jgi:hypothetical protein
MQARLLLVAAVCPFVLGCSTTEPSDADPGVAGSASNVAGSSAGMAAGAGASTTAGSPSNAGTSSSAGAVTGGAAGSGGVAAVAGSSSAGTAAGGNATAGAGGSGNAGGAPPAGCAAVNGAKFCEDWDKLPMGKPAGDYSVSSGVVVDSTKAFSGTQSLHFQKIAKPADATPNINFTKQFPLASNDMHGRVMVFMAQAPKTDSHWNFITSSNSGGTEWSIGGQYGKFELVCDPPDNGLDSKTPFPEAKWVCTQWQFKYPGNDDTTFVTKVDGVSVDQGEFTGANSKGEKWQAGTWNNLKLGWEIFGSSDIDVEFWVDDLAFGEQVIPCPGK